ncbi:MAG: DNA primase [Marinifilaceae bacterium]
MIDQSSIQKIFDSAEIYGVVSDFVTLKKRGVNYLGLCPFHNEKTPSFIVSPSKGIYKCFGCGKGGNAVNFVMELEQLSYVEALKYLASKYSIPIEEKELSPAEAQKKNARESMLIVSNVASEYFQRNLYSNEGKAIALSYFKERAFRDDIIEKFHLGYCSDQWDGFTKFALSKGYQQEYLVDTGLTINAEKGLFDRFRARVIFPIHSIAGKVIAFGGRILKTDKKTAKYLNSPESLVYSKSRVLYGLFQAKRAIVQEDRCFLVEGYTDVLSFHQSGIENVVASSGTSLTVDQIRLIKRFSNNICIVYDGDAAGIKASIRGIDLVLEQGLNVKVLLLPDGEDPDSFAKSRSASELKEYIKEHESDFIVFKTKLFIDETKNDPILRARLISSIVKSISIIPDSIIRSVYIKECSSLLQVDEHVLYDEIAKIKGTASSLKPQQIAESANNLKTTNKREFKCDIEEKMLIRYILLYGDDVLFQNEGEETIKVGAFIIEELTSDNLVSDNPLFKKFFDEYSTRYQTDGFKQKCFFRDNEDSDLRMLAVDILSDPYELSKVWTKNEAFIETEEMKLQELVVKSINEYKQIKISIMLKNINAQIRNLDMSKDVVALRQLLEDKIALQKISQILNKELGNRIIL